MHRNFIAASGQRWLLTDGRFHDWWDLVSAWASSAATEGDEKASDERPHARWVRELMDEHGVRALPRSPSAFNRVFDSREFWDTFDLSPEKTFLMQ